MQQQKGRRLPGRHLEARSHHRVAEYIEGAESGAGAAQGGHHLGAEAALRMLRRSLPTAAQHSTARLPVSCCDMLPCVQPLALHDYRPLCRV